MCGRITVGDEHEVASAVERIIAKRAEAIRRRFNVSPGQDVPLVATGELREMHWGFVPFWEKSEKPKFAPINARSETAFAKPMFRQSVQKRRCAVPADGFYEWRKAEGGGKEPFFICRRDRKAFFIAGIFEEATELRPATFALLTCAPNELMAGLHDRMPVMLDAEAAKEWIRDAAIEEDAYRAVCGPYPAAKMQAWRVSTLVNNPRNDAPECIAPVAA